jgi:hypothetical protein
MEMSDDCWKKYNENWRSSMRRDILLSLIEKRAIELRRNMMRTEERLRNSLRNFKNSEHNTRTNPQGNAQEEMNFLNVNQNNDSEKFGENLSHNLRESAEIGETKGNFKDTEAKMNTEEDSKSEQDQEENVEICCQI